MGSFLPSDIARLILGYLKENGWLETYSSFLNECSLLRDYLAFIQTDKEYCTNIGGKSLTTILEEYGQLKAPDSISSSNNIMRLWTKFDAIVAQLKHVMHQAAESGISKPIVKCLVKRPTAACLKKRSLQNSNTRMLGYCPKESQYDEVKNEVKDNLPAPAPVRNRKNVIITTSMPIVTPLPSLKTVRVNSKRPPVASQEEKPPDIVIENDKTCTNLIPVTTTPGFQNSITKKLGFSMQQPNNISKIHVVNFNPQMWINKYPTSTIHFQLSEKQLPVSNAGVQILSCSPPETIISSATKKSPLKFEEKKSCLEQSREIVKPEKNITTPEKNCPAIDQTINDFRSPRRKRQAPKKRIETPNAKCKPIEVQDISEDSLDLNPILEQLLTNTALHEKLAENINKIVGSSSESPTQLPEQVIKPSVEITQKPEIANDQTEKKSPEKDTFNQSEEDTISHETFMSEDAIRGIIEMTESDPAFKALLDLFELDRQDLANHIPSQSPLDVEIKESSKLNEDKSKDIKATDESQIFDSNDLKTVTNTDQLALIMKSSESAMSTSEISLLASDSFHIPDGFNISPPILSPTANISVMVPGTSPENTSSLSPDALINSSNMLLTPSNTESTLKCPKAPDSVTSVPLMTITNQLSSSESAKEERYSSSQSFIPLTSSKQNCVEVHKSNSRKKIFDSLPGDTKFKKLVIINESPLSCRNLEKQTHVRVLDFDVKSNEANHKTVRTTSFSVSPKIPNTHKKGDNHYSKSTSKDYSKISNPGQILISIPDTPTEILPVNIKEEVNRGEKSLELASYIDMLKKDAIICEQETPPGSATDCSSISPESLQPCESSAAGRYKKRKRKAKIKSRPTKKIKEESRPTKKTKESEEMLSKMNVDKFLAELYGD